MWQRKPVSVEEVKQRKAKEKLSEIAKRGVLIPPAFGIAAEPPLSSRRSSTPSIITYLNRSDDSYRLLNDHMHPGFWLGTDVALGSARASISPVSGRGSLTAIRTLGNFLFEVQASTDGVPNLTTEYTTKWGSLQAKLNQKGAGHVGGSYFTSLEPVMGENLDIQVGAWTPCLQDFNFSFPSAHGYVAATFLGGTMACEADVPLQGQSPAFQARTYLSMDLQSSDGNGPPTKVSLEHGPKSSTISLSQFCTIDRVQINPLEDRAPTIRNTLGWTIRMESDEENNTQLAFGGAWQINRGLCLKAIVQHDRIKTGISLKRWQHPRIACSILHQFHWKTKQASFLGINVELETGKLSGNDLYQGSNGMWTDSVPETKAKLPDE